MTYFDLALGRIQEQLQHVSWEYQVLESFADDRTEGVLNNQGHYGWELVSVVSTGRGVLLFMKRIKTPENHLRSTE